MRILDAFRIRRDLEAVTDPHHPLLDIGQPNEARQRRLEWQRAKTEEGIIARWPEIPAAQLTRSRYWLEDESGNLYREVFGDPYFVGRTVCAFYRGDDGSPVMLEAFDPPNRDEMERRRAAREQRRADRAAARTAHYDALRQKARR